ncbi:MAG: polysaccharide biosynthesis protein [Ruminococcus sp.]|nr:polysaccharide biosynthesis protein [Ruminococcus sp.]
MECREMEFNIKLKRTMIIGGGSAARILIKEIFNAKHSPYIGDKYAAAYVPVCIIDSDKEKFGTYIHGVEIIGGNDLIVKKAKELNIDVIIIAIPSLSEKARKELIDICNETKLPLKIVPFVGSLILKNEKSILNQVRGINVEELLGRDPITFDNKDIKNFIQGKRCMVTGGGGSIGSELARQIAQYEPEEIVIVDVYENSAYEIQQELRMTYGDDGLNLITLIASVRDRDRMDKIIQVYNPQIIFHAAAHKHVPLMEVSPMEAIKNNVVGTLNVAQLAQKNNVEKFVMISTDKAVNPTNVMGASKRCCEMIVQYLAQQKKGVTEFVTTRFGNVLGSNGSVIPLFKKQIEKGGPVTVTDERVIRYFMTIPEAVSLVMEAAAIAKGGEIFVLDMGEPVKIVTLAENLIRMCGKEPYVDIDIKFTGLRDGEKLYEELLMDEEGIEKTDNELIYIGHQIKIDQNTFMDRLNVLIEASLKNDCETAVQALHDMVPTFKDPKEVNENAIKEREEKEKENAENKDFQTV